MQIDPGLAVIHSNKLEDLRAVLVDWVQRYPLNPLENEAILVQSNGMAQWVKLALAETEGLGICAAVEAQLPARFLWMAYQRVLGLMPFQTESPFDKRALTWRLYRLLPGKLDDPRFAALHRFLASDTSARKRHQLAAVLADLFDQYQAYRADWLHDWSENREVLRDARGQEGTLPEDERWQPELWRTILADIPREGLQRSRAILHERFLAALNGAGERPAGLPRRILVFGISSLPKQMLEGLHALSRFCQVLMCVHNPCRYYWADIIDNKELLLAERKRQQRKPGMAADIADEDLHLHANPLLAAWGKQGRDYIRLLDEFDDTERYRDHFQRIDLFEDYAEADSRSLLQCLQQSILDLKPLPTDPDARPAVPADASIAFHVAHSPQREVEILHDQLLALFDRSTACGRPLQPREIIVMVPDINAYAPHIRAVLGQVERGDPRCLPYTVADQRERGCNPLLHALEFLLNLPEARFSVSELLDLLDVPAVRARFGIAEGDIPLIRNWIEGAGIRWGLHADQRASLNLPENLEQNSWRFGLRRMLLGYAVGRGEAFEGIEPYDEIGGLNASLIGPLSLLLDAIEDLWKTLRTPAVPAQWLQRLQALLDRFFLAENERDIRTLEQLGEALAQWVERCEQAQLSDEELPLIVAREAWLEGLEEPGLAQRFLGGSINFCTLMPMRAIPFRVVCLLGMNTGDYPRSHPTSSFDLMGQAGQYRPGDRSRREDDRYLFLEALLSAREHLYISYVGRSVRDDSPIPPSLLVEQLRDHLAGAFRAENPSATELERAKGDAGRVLLDRLTVEHPLQPFSLRYFLPDGDPRLFTYAKEWRSAHGSERPGAPAVMTFKSLAPLNRPAPTLDELAAFLRHPVKTFFTERLKVALEMEEIAVEDHEPFTSDHLADYRLTQELLMAALTAPPGAAEEYFERQKARQLRRGETPLGGFARHAQARWANPAWSVYRQIARLHEEWPDAAPGPMLVALDLRLADVELHIEDSLAGLRRDETGQWMLIASYPLATKKNKEPKWHGLLRPWVRHLAGCAAGLPLTSFWVGPDGSTILPELNPDTARHVLREVAAGWLQALCHPLPLACKTGFAWVGKNMDDPPAAVEAAEKCYDGGDFQPGEVSECAYLTRTFPSFEQLYAESAAGHFEDWSTRLYQPLWQTQHGGLEA